MKRHYRIPLLLCSLCTASHKEELSVVNMDFDEVVKDVFAEMVERHNSYKDGRMGGK